MTTTMRKEGSFTIDELHRFPSDGNRYELIQGSLHVNPAPDPFHQRVSSNLQWLLTEACPDGLEVFSAPLDVTLGPDTLVQPDLMVVRTDRLTGAGLDGPPLLVVEILSPSSMNYDRGTKRLTYEQARVPSFWIVDPDPHQSSVTLLDLDGDHYVERTVEGGGELAGDRPYPIVVRPDDLVVPGGGRRPR